MKRLFESWRAHLSESQQDKPKLLRELEEEEIEAIQGVLDEMDGGVLAFNDLFKGKNRVVIPLGSIDYESELGKFLKFFLLLKAKTSWEVDYESGIISRDKTLTPEQLADFLLQRNYVVPKQKIKIGKFLLNLAKLLQATSDLWDGNQVKDKTKLEQVRQRMEKTFHWSLNELYSSEIFDLFATDSTQKHYSDAAAQARNFASIWQKKADSIKKGGTKTDAYSIIITRHPIDILRMSDFDEIESCHSPPSRGGGSEYYKCAVAEAHGHGALAYVVNTEDLEEKFGVNKKSLQKIEDMDQFQEDEIFLDDARDTGLVTPLNRLRLRQIRYYPTEDAAIDAARSDLGNPNIGGTELAVPEDRIYGFPKIPGFREAVVNWANTSQNKSIESIPRAGRSILGTRIVMFRGSYEDTGMRHLLKDLTGLVVMGGIRKNEYTEQNLDFNPFLEREIEFRQVLQRYSNRFDYFNVSDFSFEDGFVGLSVQLVFEWGVDEWDELPSMTSLDYIPDEIAGYGGKFDIFTKYREVTVRRDGDKIKMTLPVDIEKFAQAHDILSDWPYDRDSFDNLLRKMDSVEYDGRSVPAMKEIINIVLKREGILAGSAFFNLASEVENGQIESYEWDLNLDGDYPEFYEVNATTTIYDVPTNRAATNLIKKVIESRTFKLKLRETILEAPKAESDPEAAKYFLDSVITPKSIDEDEKTFDVRISFSINEDDREARVYLFRALLEEADDEDYLRQAAQKAFLATVKMVPGASNISEKQLFNNWRAFLKG